MRIGISGAVLWLALASWGLGGCTSGATSSFAQDGGDERDAARAPGGSGSQPRPTQPAIVLPPSSDADVREDDAGDDDAGRVTDPPAECGNGVVDDGEACDTALHPCCARDCLGARGTSAVCRAAEGTCDVEERCDGTRFDCPTDEVAAETTECRRAVSVCDVAELCDGTSRECPIDTFAPDTTQCSTSIGPCDEDDFCTGVDATCPDNVAPVATPCGVAAGPCDLADACDGFSPTCVDAVQPSTTQCGIAGTGLCDVDDFCDGRNKTCTDAVATNTTICRPAANECDIAERCDGVNAACASDAFQPALTACGDQSASYCDDPNSCDGLGTCNPREIKPCQSTVFVTADNYEGGLLGGLAGADTLCTMLAQDAGLDGTYRAWLSDSSTDARDRIPDAAYVRVDGVTLANDKAQLLDAFNTPLFAQINVDENGGFKPPTIVWTGTALNGLARANHCGDWTDINQDGDLGYSDAVNQQWTELGALEVCDIPLPLYCFQTSR